MKDYLENPMGLPFLELFKKMYISGIQFAAENPNIVSMFAHLLSKKGDIYDTVFKGNLDMALGMYKSMIDRDKELGRIKKNIDSEVFAKLVIDMTINVSIDEASIYNKKFDFKGMYEKIEKIVEIFEHGVMEDE